MIRTLLFYFLVIHVVNAEPKSLVKLNGKDHPVFFNDGDSFRVLSGLLSGTKARLQGFNTLESYGPVHSWGDWTEKELYALAKMATYQARKGIWQCQSDLEKDTYGRTLWRCPNLSKQLIEKGFAHAMSITDQSAWIDDVKAQKEARIAKRGMWAHGIPEYVLTSLHSVDERSNDKPSYNRLVSSIDGHSIKWEHRDLYQECQKVCWQPSKENRYKRFISRFKKRAYRVLSKYSDSEISMISEFFLTHRESLVTLKNLKWKSPQDRSFIEKILQLMLQEGWVDAALSDVKSCMIYIDFRRRFGSNRAVCLKDINKISKMTLTKNPTIKTYTRTLQVSKNNQVLEVSQPIKSSPITLNAKPNVMVVHPSKLAASKGGITVQNFCNYNKGAADTYSKSNVIIFQVNNPETIYQNEYLLQKKGSGAQTVKTPVSYLKQAKAAPIFSKTISQIYPMKRLVSLMPQLIANSKWFEQDNITIDELQSYFKTKGNAQERGFLNYSSPCAAYVVIQSITKSEAVWTKTVPKKRRGQKKAPKPTYSVSLRPTIVTSIYKRNGNTFKKEHSFTHAGMGLFGSFFNLGSSLISSSTNQDVNQLLQQKKREQDYLSYQNYLKTIQEAITNSNQKLADSSLSSDEKKKINRRIKKFKKRKQRLQKLMANKSTFLKMLDKINQVSWEHYVTGFPQDSSCFTNDFTCQQGSFWLPPRIDFDVGLFAKTTKECQHANNELPLTVALCAAVKVGEGMSLLMQKSSKQYPNWTLYAPLDYSITEGDSTLRPSISLGKTEGVKTGYYFWSKEAQPNGDYETTGFARVMRVGPGGGLGKVRPSILKMRSGSAQEGARMVEYPQIGIGGNISGSWSTIAGKSGNEALNSDKISSMVGGSVYTKYDLSNRIEPLWGAIYIHAGLDLLTSGKSTFEKESTTYNLDWSMLNIYTGVEIDYFLVGGLSLTATALAGYSMVGVSTPDNKVKTDEGKEVNDSATGATVSEKTSLGLKYVPHPSLAIGVEGFYRLNLSDIEVKSDTEGSIFTEGYKVGSFSGLGVNLHATYTF